MTASPQTRDLRRSLAIDWASPPSPSDFNQWTLCRRTGRSHSNLLAVAALVGGDYVAFLESLGYDPDADPTRNLDNRYWRNMCYWLQTFIPQFEAHMTEQLAITDETRTQVIANIASAFNLSLEQLQLCLENPSEIRGFLDMIRPQLGAIAEMHLVRHLVEGGESIVKWYLPRAVPDLYNISGDNTEKNNVPREIRIIRGSEDD